MNIKGQIDRETIIVSDFNTSLTSMDRHFRQKIHKEIAALNNKLDEVDLIDIFRAVNPKTSEYIYFSSAHGMFSMVDHMLGHKTNLNKFKKVEITSSIFSEHSSMKLEINQKNTEKHAKTWKLKHVIKQ